MRRALVSIGVDRVTGMTPLNAAVAGAKQIAEWGRGQGCDVSEINDENGPVTFTRVFQATAAFVTQGVYEQLIVFFAGHGQLNSPTQEIWLLTDAVSNPNEAINVLSSTNAARGWGIPHVVFVSDACRSMPANRQHSFIQGGSIFPAPNPWRTNSELDLFYATAPGDPAYEVPEQDAVSRYRAIYTDCLLAGLRGEVPAAIETHPIEGADKRLVPSRKLKAHLADCVPQRAAAVSIHLTQAPEARVESALPKYLAEVATPPGSQTSERVVVYKLLHGEKSRSTSSSAVARDDLEQPQEPKVSQASSAQIIGALKIEFFEQAPISVLTDVSLDDPLRRNIDRLIASQGRESFETGTGFTFHGAGISEFAVNAPSWKFGEDGTENIAVDLTGPHKPTLATSNVALAVRFTGGTGACLAVLPGYVGNVSIDEDGRIESVTYTPSRRSTHFDEYNAGADSVNRRRAFAAVASKKGAFTLARDKAGDAARYLRMMKEIDPALGIYAAYAYAQAGDFEGVRSVYEYMSWPADGPVPFDVVMLAHFDRDLPLPFRFPPRMPMLTQGWALLGRHERHLSPAALEARKHLIPSLWSTFGPKGVDIMFDAVRQGAL